MARGDVTTSSNRGQWQNAVDGMPERSASYASADEAIEAGRSLAAELGTEHTIEPADATGVITDPSPDSPGGGAGSDASADASASPDASARRDGPPITTDERGFPLENPSG